MWRWRCVDFGISYPLSIFDDTYGTDLKEGFTDPDWVKVIEKFDLVALFVIFIRRHPIFRKTAAYGHFGRDDPDFTRKKPKKLEL